MMDISRPLGWFVHRCGQTTPEVEIRPVDKLPQRSEVKGQV